MANYIEAEVSVNGVKITPDHLPVQIFNRTIGVDFGFGCLGCSWCVTKRNPGRLDIQDGSYHNVLDAHRALKLVQSTWAYSKARLPIRLGNNTDGTLIPVKELREFYFGLPSDYPIALLTRGVHKPELTDFLNETGSNFVLCRTVTPPHPDIDYRVPMEKVLKGFVEAKCQKVLNIGPVAEATFKQTVDLIRSGAIPFGSQVIIAPLNLRKLPMEVVNSVNSRTVSKEQVETLEILARNRGYIVLRANNCAIAANNQIPSYEYPDINEIVRNEGMRSLTAGSPNHRDGLASTCPGCPNYDTCREHFKGVQNKASESTLMHELNRLGIAALAHNVINLGSRIYIENKDGIVPTKYETSYLSAMTRVLISWNDSAIQPDQRAIDRWLNNGFYPIVEAAKFATEVKNRNRGGV